MDGATISILRVVLGTTNGNNRADDARGQQVHSSHDDGHVPSEESPGHGSEQSPSGDAASTIPANPAREAKKTASRNTTMSLNRRYVTSGLWREPRPNAIGPREAATRVARHEGVMGVLPALEGFFPLLACFCQPAVSDVVLVDIADV